MWWNLHQLILKLWEKKNREFVGMVNMEITALDIVNKAMEFGFDKCGIIPVQIIR